MILFFYYILDLVDAQWTYFEEKGVTEDFVNSIKTLLNQLVNEEKDSTILADNSGSTQSKSKARKKLYDSIQLILGTVEIAYGRKSTTYKLFRANFEYNMNDLELFTYCTNLSSTTQEYLPNLLEYGLNQSVITALNLKLSEFNYFILQTNKNKSTRSLEAEARVIKMNTIYSKIAYLCRVGKLIWLDVDRVKYDEFVISNFIPKKKKVEPKEVLLTKKLRREYERMLKKLK